MPGGLVKPAVCLACLQVYALDWSPNGEKLASGSKDRIIKMYVGSHTLYAARPFFSLPQVLKRDWCVLSSVIADGAIKEIEGEEGGCSALKLDWCG